MGLPKWNFQAINSLAGLRLCANESSFVIGWLSSMVQFPGTFSKYAARCQGVRHRSKRGEVNCNAP